jgi:hypothetical protein
MCIDGHSVQLVWVAILQWVLINFSLVVSAVHSGQMVLVTFSYFIHLIILLKWPEDGVSFTIWTRVEA